jgi:hypothetical protein
LFDILPQRKNKNTAAPIRKGKAWEIRAAGLAKEVGDASKVYKTVYDSVTDTVRWSVRWDPDMNALTFTHVEQQFSDALLRVGSVVVTDANALLHQRTIERTVGYKPPITMASADDGAYIERTIVNIRGLNRHGTFIKGKPMLSDQLKYAIEYAVKWSVGKRVGVITFQALQEMLENPSDDLKPILGHWVTEPPVYGHYGATRGMNTMSDMDGVITIGDPWPNLGQVRHDIEFLGIADEVSYHDRLRELCQAELEQAHGRLRVVHRRKPGFALHLGQVWVGGYGWSKSNVTVVNR